MVDLTQKQQPAYRVALKSRGLVRTTVAFSLAAIAVLGEFALQGRYLLNLADEGFVWYGVQRVLAGEMPTRDFMAYDPARYYWSAWFMSVIGGEGILEFRESLIPIKIIVVAIGLLVLLRDKARDAWIYLPLLLLIVMLWIAPPFRVFDAFALVSLLCGIAWFLENPSHRHAFWLGALVGILAIVGRNHGLYAVVGCLLALSYVRFGAPKFPPTQLVPVWLFGIAVGYCPMLVAYLVVPGFASANLEIWVDNLGPNGTNIPLPIPWPWDLDFTDFSRRRFIIGVSFVSLLVFGVLGTLFAFLRIRQGRAVSPVAVAAAFVVLPYSHHAFSRADITHLALPALALIIGLLALGLRAREPVRAISVLILTFVTFSVMLREQPLLRASSEGDWRTVEVTGYEMIQPPSGAEMIAVLNDLIDRYARDGAPIFIAPYLPGVYAIHGRRAPVWEIYALRSRTAEFQAQEVARLEANRPVLVILQNTTVDGLKELGFMATHPMIYDYVLSNYVRVDDERIPSDLQVFVMPAPPKL